MKPSRKFLSLPIISLSEGQHIGYVKNLVIDAQSKSLAAIIVDQKGFFKDQRIVPYNKVVSVGDDAITIDKGVHVEKSTNLPEILDLIKEKLTVIGTRVITQSGKTLGIVEEFYIDPESGKIVQIEISGGKLEGLLNGKGLLDASFILTVGHDVIVTEKGCETQLQIADRGLNETLKSILHSTTSIATGTTQAIGKYFKKDKLKNNGKTLTLEDNNNSNETAEYTIEALPHNSKDVEKENIIPEEKDLVDNADSDSESSSTQEVDSSLTCEPEIQNSSETELASDTPTKKEPLG